MGDAVGGDTADEIEEQLCELGKRCSGQNFWRHFYRRDKGSNDQ